ncbi:hypothetical protein [Microvirga aerophila]|uniref:Uncharacterized protein n=1 Tax=Microvirga aerophila TaxID=670291 RepID=A0A512C3E1_9HYPH|nr:hypothetical protein [Microvirga aerophila]GEO18723.1 hypothetical protein MAE02_64190 [Microvirga aerophila]
MHIFENLVEQFLTVDGRVFVSPQHDIAWDSDLNEGGSSPDFVALDFRPTPQEVVIVEVTTGAALEGIFKRIANRETRWYSPLKKKLVKDRVIDDSWAFRFLGFVRRPNIEEAQQKFAAHSDVRFYSLEDAAFSYAYWDSRKNGLPR